MRGINKIRSTHYVEGAKHLPLHFTPTCYKIGGFSGKRVTTSAARYSTTITGMFRFEKTNDIRSQSSPTPTSATTTSFDTIEKMVLEDNTSEELETLSKEAAEKYILVLFYSPYVLPLPKHAVN
jgi:hypothetical protein